jgi:hypothetical protein
MIRPVGQAGQAGQLNGEHTVYRCIIRCQMYDIAVYSYSPYEYQNPLPYLRQPCQTTAKWTRQNVDVMRRNRLVLRVPQLLVFETGPLCLAVSSCHLKGELAMNLGLLVTAGRSRACKLVDVVGLFVEARTDGSQGATHEPPT